MRHESFAKSLKLGFLYLFVCKMTPNIQEFQQHYNVTMIIDTTIILIIDDVWNVGNSIFTKGSINLEIFENFIPQKLPASYIITGKSQEQTRIKVCIYLLIDKLKK